MFAARVELIGAGDDDPNVDDDDGQPATTTEGSVTSIQLTQSNFPIAQPVNGSFPEEEEEEVGEDQLVIEEGGDDILLDGSVNSDDSHVILMRQEVALATTDGGERGKMSTVEFKFDSYHLVKRIKRPENVVVVLCAG